LNFEYDGYLQRVLQNICLNYTMRFHMVQLEDHFFMLAIESSFGTEPTNEAVQFRVYMTKLLKQTFLVDLKNTPDVEKVCFTITLITIFFKNNLLTNL
jgi:hypothetical protein